MDPEPQTPETVAAPPRWGLGDWLLGLVASYALASLLGGIWFAIKGDTDLDLAAQALSLIGLWTGMVGVLVIASRTKGAGRLADDFGFSIRWSDVGLGVATAFAVQLVLLPLIAFLLQPILGEPEVSGPTRELIEESQGPAYLLLVASVAIGAPIVEELFFRGLLLRSLQRRMAVYLAIPLSAVAFGLAHGSTLPVDAVVLVMLSLSVFGAVLAVLAVRTGRLGASIIAHATFNLFTIVYLTLNP